MKLFDEETFFSSNNFKKNIRKITTSKNEKQNYRKKSFDENTINTKNETKSFSSKIIYYSWEPKKQKNKKKEETTKGENKRFLTAMISNFISELQKICSFIKCFSAS